MESVSGLPVGRNKLWLWVGGGEKREEDEDRMERKRVKRREGERSDLSAKPIHHVDKMVALVLFR